jgi:hypothetical protein
MSKTPSALLIFTLLFSLTLHLAGCSDTDIKHKKYDFGGLDAAVADAAVDAKPTPDGTGEGGVDGAVEGGVDAALDASVDAAEAGGDLLPPDTGPDGPPPPSHAACATPKVVALVGGKATVTDDTTTSVDEHATVDCAHQLGPWPGPQLYFSVPLVGGKAYKVTVTPTGSTGFDAALYAFPAATACTAAAINTACKGLASDKVGPKAVELLLLKPTSSASWLLVVDAYGPSQRGPFTLAIEELTPPANTTCATAQTVALGGGKASVSGDTTLSTDEFAKLSCGTGTGGPWPGPQLYYRLTGLAAGKHYKVALTASGFDAALYAFPAATTCSEAAIDAACKGLASDSSGSGPEVVVISPTAAGDWKVAVDAAVANAAGSFTLAVQEVTLPTNTSCAKAQAVTLTGGTATVAADTSLSADEFAGLKCGGLAALSGPQLYYTIDVKSGESYALKLTPEFDARLYVAPAATCTATALEQGCASGGASGDVMTVFAKTPTELLLAPSAAGTYLVGVDSAGAGGAFSLTITQQTVPTFSAPLSLNFDGDCKGLAATNDWACGTLAFSAGSGCAAKAAGPKAAHSGTGAWGTVLNDCHAPLGNNAGYTSCTNAAPNDDSILRLRVTLPATWTKASLSYWSWEDLNIPNDWGEVRVDGNPVSSVAICPGSPVTPTAWVQRTVDLTAHLGQTVTIGFHMMASPVTNLAGWYIDDLAVSGS